MKLNVQIYSFLYSYFFGVVFYFLLKINYKFINKFNIVFNYVISFLFILAMSLLYFIILLSSLVISLLLKSNSDKYLTLSCLFLVYICLNSIVFCILFDLVLASYSLKTAQIVPSYSCQIALIFLR